MPVLTGNGGDYEMAESGFSPASASQDDGQRSIRTSTLGNVLSLFNEATTRVTRPVLPNEAERLLHNSMQEVL